MTEPIDPCRAQSLRLTSVEPRGSRWIALVAGSEWPIRKGDQETDIFNADWRPVALLSAPDSQSHVLELAHIGGESATWLLDHELRLTSNQQADCTTWFADKFGVSAMLGLVNDVRDFILLGRNPPGKSLSLFARLGVASRACWMRAAREYARMPTPPEPVTYLSFLSEPRNLVQRTRSGRMIKIDPTIVRQIIGFTFVEHTRQLSAERVFRLPSVIDGLALICGLSIYVNSAFTLYRFIDESHDFVFFAFSGEGKRRILALYFPGTQDIVTDDFPTAMSAVSPGGAQWLEEAVFYQTTQHAEGILAGRTASSHTITFAYGIAHIGHHLWNDLSGVLCLLQIPPQDLPDVIAFNADASERFGKLEELFPELRHRVKRIATERGLAEECYRAGQIFVTPSEEYVSAELRRRILVRVEQNCSVVDAQLISTWRARRQLVVVLGLRVEDRTVINQVELYVAILTRIAARVGAIIALIDGINVADGVEADALAARVIQREHKVFEAIAARVDRRVALVRRIGVSMYRSLALASACTFFIAPWGAGLVKYRWVTNTPGLALASASFLSTAHDRDIYHSATMMEAPTPMLFPPFEALTDVPVSEADRQRINTGHPSLRNSVNVIVDPVRIVPLIDDLIDEYWIGRQGSTLAPPGSPAASGSPSHSMS
jgi:hypothetical protein